MDETSRADGAGAKALAVRLAVGFGAGLLLWLLNRALEAEVWPANEPVVYRAIVAAALFAPVLFLAGHGRMRTPALLAWTAGAGLLSAVIAGYGMWREGSDAPAGNDPTLVPLIVLPPLLFILHHLIAGADQARRPFAPFALYFETASTNAVRLALSLAFTGAFWALVGLGVTLFSVIGLKWPGELVTKALFWIPATATVFAGAAHLTDVRPGLIKGVRTVALTLLAWLGPLMALIAAGFLVALPITGLKPLWDTDAATAALLSATAALIVLVNAAYQDGETEQPSLLRLSVRAIAVLLPALAGLAAYGLWLRIDQYGLTPARVVAGACVLVGLVHAVGYLAAAVLPGPWMKRLEPVNVAGAILAALLLIALHTPLADPARLSVASQLARLQSGAVKADAFDFQFLRFDAGRFGREALERLEDFTGPDQANVRQKAAAARELEQKSSDSRPAERPDLAETLTVLPEGAALPDGFAATDFGKLDPAYLVPACLTRTTSTCRALILNVDADPEPEVGVLNSLRVVLFDRGTDGAWTLAGHYDSPCLNSDQFDAALAKGFRPTPSDRADLIVGGERLRFQEPVDCVAAASAD